MLVADARQAIKEDAPLDRMRSLSGELQQVYQGLLAAGAGAAPGQRQGQPNGATASADDDDVIDAEFTTPQS
jgi:molecular chaperone DnaK